jgi:hypothetical protein
MSDEQVRRLTEMIQRLEALLSEGARLRKDLSEEMVRRLAVDLETLETQIYPPTERAAPPPTAAPPASDEPERD